MDHSVCCTLSSAPFIITGWWPSCVKRDSCSRDLANNFLEKKRATWLIMNSWPINDALALAMTSPLTHHTAHCPTVVMTQFEQHQQAGGSQLEHLNLSSSLSSNKAHCGCSASDNVHITHVLICPGPSQRKGERKKHFNQPVNNSLVNRSGQRRWWWRW